MLQALHHPWPCLCTHCPPDFLHETWKLCFLQNATRRASLANLTERGTLCRVTPTQVCKQLLVSKFGSLYSYPPFRMKKCHCGETRFALTDRSSEKESAYRIAIHAGDLTFQSITQTSKDRRLNSNMNRWFGRLDRKGKARTSPCWKPCTIHDHLSARVVRLMYYMKLDCWVSCKNYYAMSLL